MKTPASLSCPTCTHTGIAEFKRYETVDNGSRFRHRCQACEVTFSETTGTPLAELKSPLSKVAAALRMRSAGLGLRATARVRGVHKNPISAWERRFAAQKKPLLR